MATAAPSPAAVEAPAKRDAKRDAKIDRPTGSALGRCTRPDGGVVGYYYAGDRSPGVAGDVIDAPGPVNVRADYPDEHNGFDARAPVRCTLGPGDQLKLTADPIEVPGAAYWVPVHSGDLLRP